MNNGSQQQDPPLTDSEARNAIHHLFGDRATLEVQSPRYVIKKDGRLLGEGPNVLISIRNALLTYCQNTGENPTALFRDALERFRRTQFSSSPLPHDPR